MQNAAANFTLIYTLPRQISAQSTPDTKGPPLWPNQVQLRLVSRTVKAFLDELKTAIDLWTQLKIECLNDNNVF